MNDYRDEINKVVDALSQDDVAQAYKDLAEAIRNCEPSLDLQNQLNGLEKKLNEFASSPHANKGVQTLEGMSRMKETFRQLMHEIYNVLGQYYLHMLCQEHPRFNVFFEKGASIKDDDVVNDLSSLLTEDAMLHLQPNLSQEQLLEKECLVQANLNDCREKVFDKLLFSGEWTKEELRFAENLLLSPITDEVSAQLFVSAITLSCFNFFDPGKYLLLIKVYKHTVSTAVKVRALVGLALCDVVMPSFMEYIGLSKEFTDLMVSDAKFGKELLKVQKNFNISVLSVDVCHDIARKMYGGAMKHLGQMTMGETEEERVRRITSDGDEEDAEMQETVDGAMNHEREGYDLYIGQFKEISRCKFFKKLYNWFMPFDEQNPTFLNFLAKTPKGREAMVMMHDHTEFCDSDLYGFIYLVQDYPQMLDNLWQQLPEKAEEESNRSLKHYGESRLLRNYVRQLLRFYMYGNKHMAFVDPFSGCQSNDYPAYCFLSRSRYNEPQFRWLREEAKEYAFAHGTSDLLLSFYDNEEPANLTVDEHLHIAEVLLAAGGEANESAARDHVVFALHAEPDDLTAHSLVYLNPASSDSEIIRSTLILLKNQDGLMAACDDDDEDRMTEEDFFDIKIKLIEAYIHTRQLEAALKQAYEMDYNKPGDERVNACLAYCLLHRNPIMVSQEQIEKVEKIIAPFLAQDLKSMLSDTIKNSLNHQEPKTLMKDLAAIFFSSTQKDPKAECVFEYCKALCCLSRHEEEEALDFLERGLVNCISKDGDFDDFFDKLIFPHGVEWLSQFGYDYEYVNLIYQRARIKILSAGKKLKF